MGRSESHLSSVRQSLDGSPVERDHFTRTVGAEIGTMAPPTARRGAAQGEGRAATSGRRSIAAGGFLVDDAKRKTNAVPQNKIELYEHFFRDPRVGDGWLQPPWKGIACRNIRDALIELNYTVAPGDRYDKELREAVRRFQIEWGHTRHDGYVGKNTRELLTGALLARGEGFFERGRVSPEYAVFLSYARNDEERLVWVVDGIRSHGIPVFRDKEAIPPGSSWPDVLFRSVRKCQVFLCALASVGGLDQCSHRGRPRPAREPADRPGTVRGGGTPAHAARVARAHAAHRPVGRGGPRGRVKSGA